MDSTTKKIEYLIPYDISSGPEFPSLDDETNILLIGDLFRDLPYEEAISHAKKYIEQCCKNHFPKKVGMIVWFSSERREVYSIEEFQKSFPEFFDS